MLAGEAEHELEARREGGTLLLDAGDVEAALGWHLEERGLCREGVCRPVDDPSALLRDGFFDLEGLAKTLGRPLAFDAGEGVVCLGEGRARMRAWMQTMQAPDFTLPDLAGTPHTLSDHRGRKVLLIAYASW